MSLKIFDPGRFESDIYAVEVRGLGRGKGVEVTEIYSVLDDPEIVEPIRDRCHELIKIIDGKGPPTHDDLNALRKEVERWKLVALERQKWGNDLQAKTADMESDLNYWRNEAQRMERLNRDYEAKIADDEGVLRRWMIHSNELKDKVNDLQSEIERLEYRLKSRDEEEELAVEEMEEILEMINSSANTDYEYLVDAVEFLLEGG